MAAPTDVHEESKTEQVLCEIEATVPTGFEELARDEIAEKLGTKGTVVRGRVNFFLPKERAKEALELRGADNLVVVLKHYRNFQFAETLDEILHQFEELVTDIDWSLGLEIWRQFSDFPHAVDPFPKDPKVIEDLGLRASSQKKAEEARKKELEAGQASGDNNIDSKDDTLASNDNETKSEPASKRLCLLHPTIPRFRATCYRSNEGKNTKKHIFQSPQAACAFGGSINDHFGWIVDLKNFDVEVVLTVEADHVFVALALTKESLHRRNITHFGSTVLRPTIAYNMLRICKPQFGDVVIDPMCGSGSIPIEAGLSYRTGYHMCGEIHRESIERTKNNIDALNERRREANRPRCAVDAIGWDATRLPLRTESVDVFITDLPFGKRSGSKVRNWVLYPRVLLELARVARLGTGRVCLLTMDKKCLQKTIGDMKGLWKQNTNLNWVNIGGLNAIVVLLQRTFSKVSEDPAVNAKPTKKITPPTEPQQPQAGKSTDSNT